MQITYSSIRFVVTVIALLSNASAFMQGQSKTVQTRTILFAQKKTLHRFNAKFVSQSREFELEPELDNKQVQSSLARIDATRPYNKSCLNFITRKVKVAATAFTIGTLLIFSPSVNLSGPAMLNDHQIVRVGTDLAMAAETDRAEMVLDQVWDFVDKYYIDRTFNGEDWSQVQKTYLSKLKSNDNDETMILAEKMVSLLGDKYTRILDKESYARMQKFDLIGVGATLMPDLNDGSKRIMVGAPPVKDSSSDAAGLRYGDYIIAVNGINTKGRTAFDIIDQIEDEPNANIVTMTVLTEESNGIKGQGYLRDVTMKRQFATIKNPIKFKISERREDGTNVGYIRISEFNSLIKAKLEEAILDLEDQGANAFILDLRSNPGGAFQSAVEIAGLFMEDKLATSVVDSNGVQLPFRTAKGKVVVADINPIAIWVDGGSASASEVFAAALHDQCRAVVMGSKSYGKGLIQAVYGLKNGGGIVITVARYATPNGADIQGLGITPDIKTNLPMLLIPGVSSDTSKVDFVDVSARLDSRACSPKR